MNLLLERNPRIDPTCTIGRLTLPSNGVQVLTLELPWVPDPAYIGGKPDVSCVPPGIYELALHNTVKHPKSFALVNPVLGVIHEPDPAHPNCRVACLIHVANVVADLEGCIGVGMSLVGTCEIVSSRMALEMFNRQVPWISGHTLEIRDPGE